MVHQCTRIIVADSFLMKETLTLVKILLQNWLLSNEDGAELFFYDSTCRVRYGLVSNGLPSSLFDINILHQIPVIFRQKIVW